jgi:hypothetical protein
LKIQQESHENEELMRDNWLTIVFACIIQRLSDDFKEGGPNTDLEWTQKGVPGLPNHLKSMAPNYNSFWTPNWVEFYGGK